MALIPRRDRLPIPPKNAKVYNQVCQYCTVGCGYKVYVWPVGEEGGVKPEQNAFGLDLSTAFLSAATETPAATADVLISRS